LTAKENDAFLQECVSFQLARGGTESAVYKTLIEPYKNDLPTLASDGLRRVCADKKYAFFGPEFLKTIYS